MDEYREAVLKAIREEEIMKQWVFNEELGFPQCPVCNRWIHVYQGDAKMNYCPNCGEPLDGEEFKKHTLNGRVAMPKQMTTLT